MLDGTRKFKIHDDADLEMKQIMTAVYDALREKGYNPINQIVGYILSEDPNYPLKYFHLQFQQQFLLRLFRDFHRS